MVIVTEIGIYQLTQISQQCHCPWTFRDEFHVIALPGSQQHNLIDVASVNRLCAFAEAQAGIMLTRQPDDAGSGTGMNTQFVGDGDG
jgi:hypothetical protein